MVGYFIFIAGCGTGGWATYANLGNAQEAKRLILKEEGLDNNDVHWDTPLLWAARNGHSEIVKFMLDRNVDVNEPNAATGETALMVAVKGNHTEVVDLLISHGADKNFKDNTGYSAIDWASQQGNLKIVEIVMGNVSGAEGNVESGNSVVAAVYSENLDIVKKLVEKGFSVNDRDEFGDSPYLAAAKTGNFEIATFLKEKGANIFETDAFGRSPLMLAAQSGNVEMASHLIEEGADINEVSNHKYSLLMFAAANGHDKMVEFLLENGANPNQLDENQRDALYLAAASQQWHIIKLLLKNGAKITPDALQPEDKSPYVMGPMYEIAGEFFLESNETEKGIEFLELAEKSFVDMSEEYSSRATGKAILRFVTTLGEGLLDEAVPWIASVNAETQRNRMAKMGALSKNPETITAYRKNYAASLPKWNKIYGAKTHIELQEYNQSRITADEERRRRENLQEISEYRQLFMSFPNPDQEGSNLSEGSYRNLSKKARRRAKRINLIILCIRESEDKNYKVCKKTSFRP